MVSPFRKTIMQDTPFQKPFNSTLSSASFAPADTSAGLDELARVFNTAIVSTQVDESRDFSGELYRLVETAPFRAILQAVRQLSRSQGIPERQAAEQLIQTFRKMDRLWTDYVFKEGVDRLRAPQD
jgi:hypothetical protein